MRASQLGHFASGELGCKHLDFFTDSLPFRRPLAFGFLFADRAVSLRKLCQSKNKLGI